jgi:hypothetical protein
VRRALLSLVAAVPVLGLADVFGQHPQQTTDRAHAATLAVSAPTRLRGGLLYQVRFDVHARKAIHHPTLILTQGWFQSLTMNAQVPSPQAERSLNGQPAWEYGPLQAGQRLTVWAYFQVNPDNYGRQHEGAVLADGHVPLARVERSVTIFP